jgi:hypothetical protein
LDSASLSIPSPEIPLRYRLLRGAVRCVLWFFSRKIRLLHGERLAEPNPAILVVNHPDSLIAALVLVAMLDRRLHCLLPSRSIDGFFRSMAARLFGMTSWDPASQGASALWNNSADALASRGIIALFADRSTVDEAESTKADELAARLVMDAVERNADQPCPAVYAVNWFRPFRSRHAGLIDIDGPVLPELPQSLDAERRAEAFGAVAAAIQEKLGENIFRFESSEVQRFQDDLEAVMREDLREDWSGRRDWKQSPDEYELSGMIKQWISRKNLTDPGRLAGWRQSVDAYREARRRCSLGQVQVETSGSWHESGLQASLAWIESVLGFPVAAFGLVNHLPAGLILFCSGLLGKPGKRDPKVEWLLRIFIVLSCYTAQVWLVNFWLGRAIAGYYALTLPVSGIYLWRYRWLFRHRTRALVLKAFLPARLARLRRDRKRMLKHMDREFRRDAESLGVAC